MVSLNSHGEIIDVNEADQMQPAKSQFECGFFACAMARSMAQPGQPPTLSVQQIITDAENWYAQYDGTDAITNTDGMTLNQLYDLLVNIGLHYEETSPNINVVKSWVAAGYPVLITLTETSVYDLALGDKNPYPWTPAGTHIILVTGIAPGGNVLVRDSANCTNLYDAGSLRPGPRVYDASKLNLVSATVVVPPWMPRPGTDVPPPQKGAGFLIPANWHDDGNTLTAPNGHRVVHGFRQWILSHAWDPADMPLEEERGLSPLEGSNPSLGNGTRQIFNWTVLEYTTQRGVFAAWCGQELLWREGVYASLYTLYQKLQSSTVSSQVIADLKDVQKILAKY